jgi:hypothetical protein
MIKREYAAITVFFGAAAGLSLVVKVWAGAEKVAFPENYARGVKYLVVNKPNKQVHEFYTAPAPIEAARKGEPMRNGTVITGVHYNAQLNGF